MGARLKIAGGTAAVMTTVIAAILTVGGPGIDFTCDQTFNDYFALSAAVNNTGNSGQVLCVNTAMGDQEPITVTAAMPADTRIIAFPPTGTIDAPGFIFIDGASNFTVEGFEFTNEKQVGIGVASNIRIVKNYAHDQNLDFVQANGADVKSGIEILGNRIKRIQYDGDFPHGYGVYGDNLTGFKFSYNECDGGSDGSTNVMADCIEVRTISDFEMKGNWIHGVKCSACGETHSDGISVASVSTDGLIEDNVLNGFAQNTMSPDGADIVMNNNLIVDGQGNCWDAHPNGSSGDIQPLRFTFTNNTIWGCGFEAISMNSSVVGSGRGSNVMTGNIFEDGSCLAAGLTTVTGNIAAADDNGMCGWSSVDNFMSGWTPNWAGTNTGEHPTYQPTNLPTGYEGAGYQPAPYGPNSCPC
jgi:hypothetical protein